MSMQFITSFLAAFAIGCAAPILGQLLLLLLGKIRGQLRPALGGANVFVAYTLAYAGTASSLIFVVRLFAGSAPLVVLAYLVGVGLVRFWFGEIRVRPS